MPHGSKLFKRPLQQDDVTWLLHGNCQPPPTLRQSCKTESSTTLRCDRSFGTRPDAHRAQPRTSVAGFYECSSSSLAHSCALARESFADRRESSSRLAQRRVGASTHLGDVFLQQRTILVCRQLPAARPAGSSVDTPYSDTRTPKNKLRPRALVGAENSVLNGSSSVRFWTPPNSSTESLQR